MRTMPKPATPVDASTVVLLRPAQPFDIFMVQRHGKSRFMGGMYVFPGGKRDREDSILAMEAHCFGVTAADAAAVLGDCEPERALGLFVAAVRETFEEADVLLAVNAHGGRPDVDSNQAFLQQARKALHAGETTMGNVMEELGWKMDLGRMRYFAHWITPPIEPRRFTARFFMAEVPHDQQAAHDEHETTDGLWLTAAQALGHYEDPDHKIEMAPPTIKVLMDMAACASVVEALASAPHAPVPVKAPRLAMDGRIPALVQPGDPLHPTEPGHKKNRFELRKGRWHPVEE